MMAMTSNRPYFIRAIYEWIVDNDLTPYLLIDADYPDVEVPQSSVNAGRVILNISPKACRGLHLDNEKIVFTARFSGQTTQIAVPPRSVLAIYAKENGRGMEFSPDYDEGSLPPKSTAKKTTSNKPVLTLVKKDKEEI